MNNFSKIAIAVAISMSMMGCSRVSQGEIGIRTNFDKTVDMTERLPGSLNQTLIGDLTTFKVKDVAADVNNIQALDAENASLKDYDMTVIYNINPTSVAELWTTKSRSFHTSDSSGDVLLMNNYVILIAKNAAVKAARKYQSLKMMDNRGLIETDVQKAIQETLKEEALDTSINISQVQVKTIVLADVIVNSANALVQAQNELARKEVEVRTASKEAERINILNSNAGAIGYMNAMSMARIAEGVATGKANFVVVPMDFKGILNVPSAK